MPASQKTFLRESCFVKTKVSKITKSITIQICYFYCQLNLWYQIFISDSNHEKARHKSNKRIKEQRKNKAMQNETDVQKTIL